MHGPREERSGSRRTWPPPKRATTSCETSNDDVPHTHYLAIKCPALFVSGTESTIAGRRTAAVLADKLPQGRLVEVEAGHMAPLTASDEVNALIMENITAAEAAMTPS